MATSKKKASELTTDETLQRIFGRKAAKKLRALVEELDLRKPKKRRKRNAD